MTQWSCCGAECRKCACYGNLCKGCNESEGHVFHASDGKPCPIYECSVSKNGYEDCSFCQNIPCDIWKNTRDPKLSDQEFQKSIDMRLKSLEMKRNNVSTPNWDEIEQKANRLLERCEVLTLASVNENGYPRICALSKGKAENFHDIYFVTARRPGNGGKAAQFEQNSKASVCYTSGGDSVTLIGTVEFIEDRAVCLQMWKESDEQYIENGVDNPDYRLIKFHTTEATFWVDGIFETREYQ